MNDEHDRMIFKTLYMRFENDLQALLKGYRAYLLSLKRGDLPESLKRASALAQVQHELQPPAVKVGQVWAYSQGRKRVYVVTKVKGNVAEATCVFADDGRTSTNVSLSSEGSEGKGVEHMLKSPDWKLVYDP